MSVQIVGFRVDYEYGYGGWTGKKTNVQEVVAMFDCEKDAKQYIKDSRLKHPIDRERPFKQKSLLSLFESAIIREPDDPPSHNPQMEKRSK